MKKLLVLWVFPVLAFGQPKDSVKQKNAAHPDMTKISGDDIKWTKAEGGSFWFYYKPSMFFFATNEFNTITLENGDVMIFLFDPGVYLLLPDYGKTPLNVEHGVEVVSTKPCVFVRRSRGLGFYIFDEGLYVDNLQDMGLNAFRHVYVFRSRRTDKRYYVSEPDFLYGPYSKAVPITSE